MWLSNTKPFTRKPLPGDKRPCIKTDILFYKVEDYDKSNSGDKSVIHVKIDKAPTATMQNTKKVAFPVIIYVDHQIPKAIHVLREIMISIFDHLGITTYKIIDQRWNSFVRFLKDCP